MSRPPPRLKAQSPPPSQSPIPSLPPGLSSSSNASTSDRTTLLLIRRTLCPSSTSTTTTNNSTTTSDAANKGGSSTTPAPNTIDELLPPLTSSNEVDFELYAFIAIIVREFVNTWYGKITPDQGFVEEVVRILAHCTRGLEQRLRKVDLESVVFDEIPELLEVHVRAYRISHHQYHPPPLESNARQIYHSLNPLPALSPVPDDNDDDSSMLQEQAENEAAYRQLLVQGVLAVLLPTEDLENECLNSLVRQILSEMILGGGIGGKAAEPWLLWEAITKIAEIIHAQMPKAKAEVRAERSKSLSIQDARSTVEGHNNVAATTEKNWSFQKTFWLILQYLFVVFTAIRFVVVTVANSSSLPSRTPLTQRGDAVSVSSSTSQSGPAKATVVRGTTSDGREPPLKVPIVKMKIWTCLSSLLLLDARMPWLSATISLVQWGALMGPGKVANTDGMIDRYVTIRGVESIHTHFSHLFAFSLPLSTLSCLCLCLGLSLYLYGRKGRKPSEAPTHHFIIFFTRLSLLRPSFRAATQIKALVLQAPDPSNLCHAA
ncbi:PXA domain-containing protein [Xylogone sp. PMI_703]|nr:PXA domain-containing protein [Xylogone sp. PMI_703]